MTDSPRRDGNEPTQPLGSGYPGYSDPAYANQPPYGPGYQAPTGSNPTQRLPQYPPYGYDPYTSDQFGAYPPGAPVPPPGGPGSPRWLWVAAIVAALVVIGLVIALVITNGVNQQTTVAPLTPLPEPSFTTTTTTRTPTTTSRAPAPVVPPSTTATPTTTAESGVVEQTTYDVTGNGRAISITYLDTGGVLQTEFNVMLPWHKQVELASPAEDSASVSIINVGRDVTCTVTIEGVRVQRRTGSGLTICVAGG